MEVGFSQAQLQKVLRQRNLLVLASAALTVVAGFGLVAASSRDREVILQPISNAPLTVSSAGVSRPYLEMVTRDAAVMMFNRTPASLEYWTESVLKIVHPSAYGQMKGELLKLANDQRGSSVAYFFTIEGMKVDPDALTSQVSGVLHTMVGRQEVSALKRTYQFQWTYTGLELRLVRFGALETEGAGPGEGAAGAVGSEDSASKVR